MRKNKTVILLVILIILTSGIYLMYNREKRTAEIGGQKFTLELAQTPTERQKGLGGRKNLCPNCTMLFVFPEKGSYSFWMKDMNFDLDILWISDGKIVYIYKNISHESKEILTPPTLADKVLEINAGLSDKYNFQVGDDVKIGGIPSQSQ